MAEDYKWWYEYHREDYNAVQDRLKATRNVLLHGRDEAAIRLLKVSHVNAILSIQTERERHERAFTAYYAGGIGIERATSQTVYGTSKSDWIHHNFSQVDWKELLNHIRGQVFAGNAVAAVDAVQERVKGLSWVKGGFCLAMCGVTEVACPDSRTRQELGIDSRIRSEKAYRDALQQIDEAVPIDTPLFIKQWVLYDSFAQEHADHMPFFSEALQLSERSNSL